MFTPLVSKSDHQPPVRFELTTPGLQDQCSNHWAMEALRCSVIVLCWLSNTHLDWLDTRVIYWHRWKLTIRIICNDIQRHMKIFQTVGGISDGMINGVDKDYAFNPFR